jgi:tetratricopeptide (TPR) repeat protein
VRSAASKLSLLLSSISFGSFVVAAVFASTSHAATLDELVKRPLPLRAGVGSAHDTVATASKQAQAFYDQGLAYLHSYVWLEAARSFNQALRLDPLLAMAHLGLTIAYTELNAPPAARAALDRAKTLAATDHDRAHINARELQMGAESATSGAGAELASPTGPTKVGPYGRATSDERLAAYRSALDAALAKYPQDEELWLLRGQAESTDPAERGQGSVAGSIRFYEKAQAIAPAHFAAYHYLAHAYENTGRVSDALRAAAAYATMAPGVPHARHMHGHDLRRVGRIDEAIEEFHAAHTASTAYFKAEAIPVVYDWHYQHNLDLLAASYQYVGQMASAEPLFKESFAIPSSLIEQEFNKREWPVFLRGRGRSDEALAAANVLAGHRSPLISAIGHVEAGRALLQQGKFQAATDEANAALRLIRGVEGGGLVATPLQTLQGEFFLRTGQTDKGRPMLQEVVKKIRLAAGPDAWTQAMFTIEEIARAARDIGDWELAGWAARQMVEHDPNYAGAHLALALVARHAGDEKTAHAESALAAKYWSKADPDLPELQAIRSGRNE